MDKDFGQLVMECNNCHLQFYAPELNVDPRSNVLVCRNCLSFPEGKVKIIKDRPLKPKKELALPARPIAAQKAASSARPAALKVDQQGYRSYKCPHCHYSFRRKGNFNGYCPYCGKRV